VACLNATCWAVIVPAFQGPDEQAHFAYVQLLAEAGRLPSSNEEAYSPEERLALADLRFLNVILDPILPPVASLAQQRHLEHDLALPLSRVGHGSAGVASSQPPLYYALATIPYALGSGGDLLERMLLVRLLSVLLAGVTVLFTFLFLREALPGTPWAWTVGTLGAALSPLLAFASSAVDPDALLFAVCAALFYAFARTFRRGMTMRAAAAIGALTAIGIATKLNFLGLLPGVLLGLVLLTLRERRSAATDALRRLALGGTVALSPAAAYLVLNLLSNHAAFGLVSDGISSTLRRGGILREISYLWQLYLPRLPGMHNDFAGIFTPYQVWFSGLVGRYNWLETNFPGWVYTAALVPALAIAGLGGRELLVNRAALRSRLGELSVYLTMVLGTLGLLGADSYLAFPDLAAGTTEPRYLLPLLALYAGVLALAARGAGRRWGPAIGALIVVGALGHSVFSQLLEISRFYG
jgi:4-amino-4-deoxy-L-arabinose transferase-like glycosyltransferase